MDPLTAMAIVGTGMQIYGTLKASKDQASLLRKQAALDDIKANEILERLEMNNDIVRERSGQSMAEIQARSGGASISSGAIMQGLEEVARLAAREIAQQTREATFEAKMVRYGADSMREQASEVRKAGALSALGTGLMGGANLARNSPGTTGSKKVTGSGATTSGSLGLNSNSKGISLLSPGGY